MESHQQNSPSQPNFRDSVKVLHERISLSLENWQTRLCMTYTWPAYLKLTKVPPCRRSIRS